MRIKQIDASGFKSFCDPVRVIFDSAVTAVVGPNGCGKSNIVDAIRWALGEQSAKNLRGKAMEDVIFNGSENRGPQSMAEVTITFDNTDGLSHQDYVNFTEVSVTRRLHRDGTSDYMINKVPCRLMDVTNLFLGTGGGARAYSIIEQGRIGLIVSSRSEDRRNMIEEAAGITKYKSARRTAERRMDQTRQNLLRVTDIVNEIERNLASLNRQAKKAERYQRYRAEQTDLDLHMATHRYLELTAEKLALAKMRREKEADHLESQTAFETYETTAARMRIEEQEIRSKLDRETAIGYELNNQIQIVENEIRHLQDAINRLGTEEKGIAEQVQSAFEQQSSMAEEASVLKEQLSRLERDKDSAGERFAELENLAKQARQELEEKGAEHDDKRERISRSRARLAAGENAVQNLRYRIEEAKARLQATQDEKSSLEVQIQELDAKSSRLGEETTKVEEELERCKSDEQREKAIYEDLQYRVELCEEERQRVRDDLQIKTSRKESLEEVMRGLESHDGSVRDAVALLEREDPGLLQGLLVDEIACPEKYEKALAAALGDRLQGLLVRNRDAGGRLLSLLKENETGRVVVLPQEEMVTAEAREEIVDSRIEGSLSRFLKISSTVENVVPPLLNGVYVVDNATIAEELWHTYQGQAAFVTLDGQLLEAEGVMKGGRAGSQGADLLRQKREIRELSDEIDSLNTLYADLEERLSALKEELIVRKQASEEARDEIQLKTISLAEVRKDHVRAAEDLGLMRERFTDIEAELQHQEEMLQQACRDQEQAIEETALAREEIAQLETFLEEQRSIIDDCRFRAEELTRKTSDIRVQAASLEQQWQNARQRISQLEQAEREVEDRVAKLEEKRTRCFRDLGTAAGKAFLEREQLGSSLGQSARVRAQIQELRQTLETASAELGELEGGLKEQRKQAESIRQEISDLKMNERENSLAIEHLIDSVWERNDCNLLRVAGDYHMRPLADEETAARAEELSKLIARMGPINLAAIDEFEQESTRHEQLVEQKTDLEQALEDLEAAIARMDKDSRRRFKETFEDVNRRFKDIFPRLFKGGRAELQLTDPTDMLKTGVDIIAQPPGKRLGNIELMSGGEKALTAVSLLFAIFLHRPSPFCLLDEVDAPLDEANIGRFIDMVQQMTNRSQFIIITHSRLTMERSDTLYGVTMEEPGVSKMVSVRIKSEEPAIAAGA